jgi:hypothetical protein
LPKFTPDSYQPVSTITSHNASVIKIRSEANSIARFRIKMIVFYFKNALACYNAGVIAVNSKVVGLVLDIGQKRWNLSKR